jgi:hypothetical protein
MHAALSWHPDMAPSRLAAVEYREREQVPPGPRGAFDAVREMTEERQEHRYSR